MSKVALFENANLWDKTLSEMTAGLDGIRKVMMESGMSNLRRVVTEGASTGSMNAGAIAVIPGVVLPLIRRSLPGTIAPELISVQPLDKPADYIRTLRAVFASTSPADGSGVVPGTEALGPFQAAPWYSGNEVIATPASQNTSNMEGRLGNKMSFQVMKELVEVGTRRLAGVWTMESEQDYKSIHGGDAQSEMVNIIGGQLSLEIDQEILTSLRRLPTTVVTFDQSKVTGTAVTVSDEHSNLAPMIYRESNRIAARVRSPGAMANWAVGNNVALTIMQSAKFSGFNTGTDVTFNDLANVQFAGTFNGRMKVYSDTYASDDEILLLGFKGREEYNACAFYMPYIPLMSTQPIQNYLTLETTVGFMTRYAYKELTNKANTLGNSADYVSGIRIINPTFY